MHRQLAQAHLTGSDISHLTSLFSAACQHRSNRVVDKWCEAKSFFDRARGGAIMFRGVGVRVAATYAAGRIRVVERFMSDEKMPSERREAKSPSKDIVPLLKGWDYEPGTI